MIVTMRDLRAIGMYCRAREWLRRHGVEWGDFLTHGVHISVLDNGDALGRMAAQKVRELHGWR